MYLINKTQVLENEKRNFLFHIFYLLVILIQPSLLFANENTGSIFIDSKSDSSEIYLNGIKVGIGSCQINNLKPGIYVATSKENGHERAKAIKIETNSLKEIRLRSKMPNIIISPGFSMNLFKENYLNEYGLNFYFGIKPLDKHIFGLEYQWAVTHKDKPSTPYTYYYESDEYKDTVFHLKIIEDEWDARGILGGGINYFFNGIPEFKIIKLNVGAAVGFWRYKDNNSSYVYIPYYDEFYGWKWNYSDIENKKSIKELFFFSPKVLLLLGKKPFYFALNYQLLMGTSVLNNLNLSLYFEI